MTLSSSQKSKPSKAVDGILPKNIGVFKRYTHMNAKRIGRIKSPLDNLNLKGGGDCMRGG
jgi:hypothetical protein